MAGQEDLPFEPPQQDGAGTDGEEFVFRFRLEQMAPEEIGYDDPLLELVRGQLADLMEVVVLTYHGEPVMVDGFRLLTLPDEQYQVFPDSAGNAEQ